MGKTPYTRTGTGTVSIESSVVFLNFQFLGPRPLASTASSGLGDCRSGILWLSVPSSVHRMIAYIYYMIMGSHIYTLYLVPYTTQ